VPGAHNHDIVLFGEPHGSYFTGTGVVICVGALVETENHFDYELHRYRLAVLFAAIDLFLNMLGAGFSCALFAVS
jgi:hypothetical protein